MKALTVRHETCDQETPAKAQSTPSFGGKINYLKKIVYYYFPIFAALASLREIFRVYLLAMPCQNADHGYAPDKLPTALDTTLADSEGSCDAPSHSDFPRRLIQYQGWKLQKKVGLFVVSCR